VALSLDYFVPMFALTVFGGARRRWLDFVSGPVQSDDDLNSPGTRTRAGLNEAGYPDQRTDAHDTRPVGPD
jgi:hypothetical protein